MPLPSSSPPRFAVRLAPLDSLRPDHGGKVVLDTNVYISIFNWPASPLAEIWRLARQD